MSQGFSDNSWIGVGGEVTLGTLVTRTKFHPHHGESLKISGFGSESRATLYGTSQNRKGKPKRSADGEINLDFAVNGMEWLLKHAMGTLNTTGAGPYTHTFALARALPTGLSIECNRDSSNIGATSSFNYQGCQIAKLTLKHAPGEFLSAALTIIGVGNDTLATVSTPTFATFVGFDWDGLTMTVDAVSQVIMSLDELTIDNNLNSDRYQMGQQYRKGFGRAGQRKITGKIMCEFDSLTAANYYRSGNGGPHALIFTWAAGSSGLVITIPAAYFTSGEPVVEEAGPIKLPLEFEAYINSADGDELTAVLTNDTVGTGIP